VDAEKANFLRQQVIELESQISRSVEGWLNAELGYADRPRGFHELRTSVQTLAQNLNVAPAEIPDELLPVLKRAILTTRLDLASKLDVSKSRVSDPEMLELLERKLKTHDALMTEDWFRQTKAAPMPNLANFLTIERVERVLRKELPLPKRQYDEKFHILQAPTLFLSDLYYQRRKCAMRGLQLVVAFMDIDDFKSFNTAHGETHIDRYLLPSFMAALEGHVYGHGFAYRFGGDEYVLLLPNADRRLGTILLGGFQERLRKLAYVGVERRTTVSIGFCEVAVDAHLTDREILGRAERAKNVAKGRGKNCITTYEDELLEKVVVLAPR
jgi:diguanylate cyclase (GGDEF)-like protein